MKKIVLEKLIEKLERENFTGKRLIEMNFNQGKISRIYEYPVKKEVKE